MFAAVWEWGEEGEDLGAKQDTAKLGQGWPGGGLKTIIFLSCLSVSPTRSLLSGHTLLCPPGITPSSCTSEAPVQSSPPGPDLQRPPLATWAGRRILKGQQAGAWQEAHCPLHPLTLPGSALAVPLKALHPR